MKIPKSIDRLIERRVRAAQDFSFTDYELSRWLDKNGIATEPEDTFGGVESIVNPVESADRIRKAIHDK